MSGICPTTPSRSRNTFSDTIPTRDTYTILTPNARYNLCEPTVYQDSTIGARPNGTDTTTTICCPSPGPAGPAGPAGPVGPAGVDGVGIPVGGTAGQVLTKIDATNYNTQWTNPATGTGTVVWRGYWQSGTTYVENDYVTHLGTSYMCTVGHTSSISNEPDQTFDYQPGGAYWIVASIGTSAATMNKLVEDSTSWFDGVVDWLGDMKNWDADDLAKLVFGGMGLYLGSQLVEDMFAVDPVGDGQAGSVYDGDPCYDLVNSPITYPTLPAAISRICEWAGVTSYDVSALPATPVNFTIANATSARNILELLSNAFFFDMVDSGGVLKFIPRASQTSVATLTSTEDLGWVREGSIPSAPVSVKRYQGVDLPRSVTVEYFSSENAHNTFVQTAKLETFEDGQDVKLVVPMTLTEQEAYDMAEKALVNAHVERMNYSWTTTYEHLDLEPGDVVTVDTIGAVRILSIEEDRDGGLLTMVGVGAAFNAESYVSSGIPASTPITYSDVPLTVGYSSGIILELPPMSTTPSDKLMLAPHGFGAAGWPGCVIYYSIDGGVSFTEFANATTQATWGKVAIAVPTSTNSYSWEDTTTITVELKTGTLSSYNHLDVLNGKNWAMIGQEIIGFRTATLTAPNTYQLSGLIRGRKGTEPFMSTHANSEMFVLLNDALIEFPYTQANKSTTFQFKFVTIGSDISKATAVSAMPNTASRRPWIVSNLAGVKVGNDWSLTWVGRNQFDGEMVDATTVINPDGFAGYMIHIVQTGSPEVIKRSVIQQTTTYTYSAADQIADWGSLQSTITIRIAQIDLNTGPGLAIVKSF